MRRGTCLSSTSPAKTAKRADATRAAAAPKKMAAGDLDFAERDITISWVLSPNSAKKIRLNVIKEAFQSNAGSPQVAA